MAYSADVTVTQLLLHWGDGDEQALGRLLPLVYEQLKQLAHARLAAGHPIRVPMSTSARMLRVYRTGFMSLSPWLRGSGVLKQRRSGGRTGPKAHASAASRALRRKNHPKPLTPPKKNLNDV